MREREDVSGFVESFSGSNRHVLDFLAEEASYRRTARELAESGLMAGSESEEVFEVEGGDLRPEALLEALGSRDLFRRIARVSPPGPYCSFPDLPAS